jgi:hypothetical protein
MLIQGGPLEKQIWRNRPEKSRAVAAICRALKSR